MCDFEETTPSRQFEHTHHKNNNNELMQAEDANSERQNVGEKGRDVVLYVHTSTLDCVLKYHCIPCLYKLFPEGLEDKLLHRIILCANYRSSRSANESQLVEDDKASLELQARTVSKALKRINFPRNVRPELCPRSGSNNSDISSDNIYCPSEVYTNHCKPHAGDEPCSGVFSVLTLGDGDFSFSLSIAEKLLKQSNSSINISSVQLTATSHESLASVLETYKPHAENTLKKLHQLNAEVYHEVDASNLAATQQLHNERVVHTEKQTHKGSKRKRNDNDSKTTTPNASTSTDAETVSKPRRFDVVIWNFPCLSVPAGKDGQARELLANQELLTKFFINVRPYLRKHSGEVHISHKTVEPFSWWGIKQLADNAGLDFAYAIIFDRCNYPGYTNRKALDRKSFPCNDAQTYVFVPKRKIGKGSMRESDQKSEHIKPQEMVISNALIEKQEQPINQQLTQHPQCSEAQQRTRLRLLLDNNVLKYTLDRNIATEILLYLIAQYPNS